MRRTVVGLHGEGCMVAYVTRGEDQRTEHVPAFPKSPIYGTQYGCHQNTDPPGGHQHLRPTRQRTRNETLEEGSKRCGILQGITPSGPGRLRHRRTGQHPLGGGADRVLPEWVVAEIFRDPYPVGGGVVADIFRDPYSVGWQNFFR